MAGQGVAVIGAGLAGLAAARALVDAGQPVMVFDKSRGLGGRLATRRGDVASFDHGAPIARGEGPIFDAFARRACEAGAGTHWSDGLVGTPGMSALARPMAAGMSIQRGQEIAGLARGLDGFHLTDTAGVSFGPFTATVVAIPAPQAARLVPEAMEALETVVMAPVWALMAAFRDPLGLPNISGSVGAFSKVIRNSAKPGREGPEAIVAHAHTEWTSPRLEETKDAILPNLLAELAAVVGQPIGVPLTASAHRWRYGRTEQPLGAPFLEVAPDLLLGGDWALGANAGDALMSGNALAEALLSRL